jgi:hypothetical protein
MIIPFPTNGKKTMFQSPPTSQKVRTVRFSAYVKPPRLTHFGLAQPAIGLDPQPASASFSEVIPGMVITNSKHSLRNM